MCDKGGETLEQVAQRSGGCPIIGNVQVQAACSFEQPGIVKHVTTHNRGMEQLIFKGPFQPKPFFDSMIHIAKYQVLMN